MARYHIPEKAVRDMGFRSKLEMVVNKQLNDMGVTFSYEGPLNVIKYVKPETHHKYLADFLLSNGIIIEAKGMFTIEDRKKHLYIKEQHPHLDIRFLFMGAKNKISKGSKTTYADWCDKHGFKWADKVVPQEWIDEVKPAAELQAIIDTLKGMK